MSSRLAGQRKGVWEPLPYIVYGYAVHPLSPSVRENRLSRATRLSTVTEGSSDSQVVYRDVVSLEVGDEVYAFEKYTPRGKEVEGPWYRGYVVCTNRRAPIAWVNDPSASSYKPPAKNEDTQQVFLGIFPASHIFVRDEVSDAEGRLPTVVSSFHGGSSMKPMSMQDGAAEFPDDEAGRKSFRLGRPENASSSRAGLPVYPPSVRSASPTDEHTMKPLPPRPSLKSGDDTAAGAEQPIIDEIASVLREWHTLMFQYLARRDYNLFHTVREHIEALHLGRRQLLAKTLSEEEIVNLRRECVARLVSCNVVQGLDVVVRHPDWGGLVTVDVEGEIDPRSWVSAVRMYAMQVTLAYMEQSALEARLPVGSEYTSIGPLPTPANSAFPEFPRARLRSHSFGSLPPIQEKARTTTVKFYHVSLELRAFVASLCAPGETAELFFSLYNRVETKFVSEEFCAVLNHHGVLARDPSARIRTLFTDLVQSDVQDAIYLVCRIVRNGALKLGSNMSTSGPAELDRRPSSSSVRGENSTVKWATDPRLSNGNLTPVTPNTPTFELSQASSFRRPFGCAVLELTQLSKMAADNSDVSSTREHTMPIYVATNEATFSVLHQDIIANMTKEFEKSPRAEMLAVSIKVFHGQADTIVRENPSLLQDAALTQRLGFPDVVFPGDTRNDFYIKLWSGKFVTTQQTSSRLSVVNNFRNNTTQYNVQITMEVRDAEGKTVERMVSLGSGEPMITQANSMVFFRNSEPTYGELIKVSLPSHAIPNWHLFFTFRYRHSREKNAKANADAAERPFAFGFLPLLPDNGAFLEDGIHTLVLYKAERVASITSDMYLGSTPSLGPGQKLEQIFLSPDMLRVGATPTKDELTVRSSLCSTKITQNTVLLSLLNWERAPDKEFLQTILSKFTFVGEVEIVKFLRDIFDSLFGILVSQNNQSGEMDVLVFNALVTVLGIVQDRRFSNFQPVLDVYIENHFSCAGASSHIIHSMNRLLVNPTSNETASALRAALKVWRYIFKFVARSRELQKAKELGMGSGATAEHLEASFRREVQQHLNEINRMMSTPSPPSIIGTQTIALQHFTSILPDLAKIFSTVQLVSVATAFATSVAASKGRIVIWKLIMFLQLVKGFLFDNAQARQLLVAAVVIWIKPHFGRFDEYSHLSHNETESARDAARIQWLESTRLCVTIVAVMLDKLQQSLVAPSVVSDRNSLRQEQDNVEYLLSLLPRLLDSYREFQNTASLKAFERTRLPATMVAPVPVVFPESYPFTLLAHLPNASKTTLTGVVPQNQASALFNCGLSESAITFLVLVLSSPKKDILNFLQNSLDIEGKDNFASLISSFFKVAISILDNDAFPSSWLNVNVLAHQVLIRMADPVATLLEREFIPDQDNVHEFKPQLWKEAVYMLLRLLSSEHLPIEELSPEKRRAVWRLAGDVRGEGAAILLRLWEALGWPEDVAADAGAVTRYGNYQIALNSLVGHVVNLCLNHHDVVRNNSVQILYSMIVSEYSQNKHFNDIENELVNKLDALFMSDSKADDISRAFFIGQLRHLFDSSAVDEQLRNRVSEFLDSVDLFLELLLNVRALPEGEEYADDRVIATLRLMNFLRRINRDEIYIKYVHQLVNMHLQSQNYVEAALTLKLHSDLHEWDLQSFVEPMEDLGLPQQSQFHRKETLCLLILDYLGKGKAWENALEICKELAYQHAEVTFNYARLAEILRHQAALLEHIVTDQRYYSDYFRVAFYGNFPVALRNKQFIYRGYEWEKFGAFCERMLNKHPGASLLKSDPSVDIRFGNDQYIQCTAVTPDPDRSLPIFTNPDVPIAIRAYYEHSAINTFSASRQIAKHLPDGDQEIWVEKMSFYTEESFPTVLRRSEVVETRVEEISPLENALAEVESKTKDLETLHARFALLSRTTQNLSTNALSMALNNAVDAPLNGGIGYYREVFLASEYISRFPDRAGMVVKLRDAIDDHVRAIAACLRLHGQLCPQEMLPFHETLEGFFRKNFHDEIQRLPPADTVSETVDRDDYQSKSSHRQQAYVESNHSHRRSTSTHATTRPIAYTGPLQLNMMSPPASPGFLKAGMLSQEGEASKQTPLQRHLAHLARHGMTGVSSGPGDNASDTSSPRGSLVNLAGPSGVVGSGTSITTSILGSVGSVRGRWSRLGSISFGRRDV